jgi:hypothetical protein
MAKTPRKPSDDEIQANKSDVEGRPPALGIDMPAEASQAAATSDAPASSPAEPVQKGRQSAAPFCPYHPDTRCESRGSTPHFTRYYCPVEGCTFSIKQQRPDIRRRIAEQDEDFSAR